MYLGDKKIQSLNGGTVIFEDGTEQQFSESFAQLLVTKKKCEPKDLFEKKILSCVSQVVKVFYDASLTTDEMLYASSRLENVLNQIREAGMADAFGKTSMAQITIRELKDVVDKKLNP